LQEPTITHSDRYATNYAYSIAAYYKGQLFLTQLDYLMGNTIQGWTSLLVSLWFIGGITTTGVGITGVYVGKIYNEVKRRPRYFIEQTIQSKQINKNEGFPSFF